MLSNGAIDIIVIFRATTQRRDEHFPFVSRNDATTQRRDEQFPSVACKVAKPQ
jgi:hypothetical protein